MHMRWNLFWSTVGISKRDKVRNETVKGLQEQPLDRIQRSRLNWYEHTKRMETSTILGQVEWW